MKKIYTVVICFALSIGANAQITLTDSSIPSTGSTYTYHALASPILNSTLTGPNYTWDFSNLIGAPLNYDIALPSAGQIPNTFPTASYVEIATGGENYYITSSSEQSLLGHYIPNISEITYTNKREVLLFPTTYNDIFNETFAGNVLSIPSSSNFDRSGTIKIHADGYGDIILPYGTVSNVLRVTNVLNYGDVFNGVTIGTYVDTIIRWYDGVTNNIIASYVANYLNGSPTPTLSQFSYIDQSHLGTGSGTSNIESSAAIMPLKFYPNPARDAITLNYDETVKTISIIDIKGRTILSINPIDQINTVDVSNFSSGFYFVKYDTQTKTHYEKLIIE